MAIDARPDRWEFPAQAGCPVLVVGASDDQVVPTAEQRRWAVANGEDEDKVTYVEVPRTGHILPVEAPEELVSAMSDWIGTA